MIVDNNKGRLTYGEALNYDIGFSNYLWYKTIKENKAQKKDKNAIALSKAIEDEL